MRSRRWALMGWGLGVLGALWVVVGQVLADTCVPFVTLCAPTAPELARLNVKFTFLDGALEVVPSLVLRVAGAPLNIRAAKSCGQGAPEYSYDDFPLRGCQITGAEMLLVADSLAVGLSDEDCDSDTAQLVSVSIIDVNGDSSRVGEMIVPECQAGELLKRVGAAVATNDSATTEMLELACDLMVAEPEAGVDKTNAVAISLSPVRLRRADGVYASSFRILNTSGTTLTGTARLVLLGGGSVEVVGADGETPCNANPPNLPYLEVPLGTGLGPGEAVSVPVAFANPNGERVLFPVRRLIVQ